MNIDCNVIRDLLPLYTENITSETSAALVREHVAGCEACRTALEQLQMPKPMPLDTEIESLRTLKASLRRRTVLTVLTTIFLILTILTGLFISATVPVWLSVDEAVIFAEQEESGRVKVKLSDKVSGITSEGDNRFCCKGVRVNWLLKASRSQMPNNGEHYFYYTPEEGQPLWYEGQYTGESDTLLWGTGDMSAENSYYREMDRSLFYVLFVSVTVGCGVLICGIFLEKKRFGKFLLILAALLLCCSASCVFVTGGHFYAVRIHHVSMLKFSDLVRQYVGIAAMTLISFFAILSSGLTIRAYKE